MATKPQDQPLRGAGLERLHIWQIQVVRDVMLVAALVGLVWLGYALRAVTVPLLVALLLAYLFEPLVAGLTRRGRISRAMVVVGILGSVGAVVVAVLAMLLPTVVGETVELLGDFRSGRVRLQVEDLASHVPQAWRDRAQPIIEFLPGGPGPADGGSDPTDEPAPPFEAGSPGADDLRLMIRQELARARTEDAGQREDWLGVARGGARTVKRVLGGVIKLGFLAFLIPFYFFSFSVSYPAVARFAQSLLPESGRSRTVELLKKMDGVVAGFVRGRIVIALIMGVMLAVGWAVCGVPHSITLGLVVGVFCAIPYLGLIGIPVAVALLAYGELGGQQAGDAMAWWQILLWPTLVFAIVQLIEGYVLTPLIAGRATGLDPVTILVAVLAGGTIMGVYGMLLAIPLVACLKIFITDVVLPRVRAWTAGEVADPLPIGGKKPPG